MYTLLNIQEEGLEYLLLENKKDNSKARICLNQGGRLDQLVLNTNSMLSEIEASTYKDNYASAILFPFPNRIENGEYEFNHSNYKLDCNETGRDNAIHGLVYNKMFECVDSILNAGSGAVTLRYNDDGKALGFPFKYSIELTYKLNKNSLSLTIEVLNKDKNQFPFALGWHPYFQTKDLQSSSLNFESNKQFQVNQHQIPLNEVAFNEVAFNETMPFQLKDRQLDTGYKLNNNLVEFLTPNYILKIKSTVRENYLQLYIPSLPNSIAIEPMTSAPNSFNNKIGLQTLNPNTNYKVEWTISIEN